MRVVFDPDKLKAVMAKRGLSQSELGRRLGDGNRAWQSVVNRWLKGAGGDPADFPDMLRLKSFGRLLTVLNLTSIDALITYLPEKGDPPRRGRKAVAVRG